MKKEMKLKDIIDCSEPGAIQTVLTEIIYKYKKSLYIYFKRQYCCEPVLVVTTVFNAAQYAFIAPANEFQQAIEDYVNDMDDMTQEEKDNEAELINFQSIMLKDF